jgi:hypothetical protein
VPEGTDPQMPFQSGYYNPILPNDSGNANPGGGVGPPSLIIHVTFALTIPPRAARAESSRWAQFIAEMNAESQAAAKFCKDLAVHSRAMAGLVHHNR